MHPTLGNWDSWPDDLGLLAVVLLVPTWSEHATDISRSEDSQVMLSTSPWTGDVKFPAYLQA